MKIDRNTYRQIKHKDCQISTDRMLDQINLHEYIDKYLKLCHID